MVWKKKAWCPCDTICILYDYLLWETNFSFLNRSLYEALYSIISIDGWFLWFILSHKNAMHCLCSKPWSPKIPWSIWLLQIPTLKNVRLSSPQPAHPAGLTIPSASHALFTDTSHFLGPPSTFLWKPPWHCFNLWLSSSHTLRQNGQAFHTHSPSVRE